MKDLSQLLRVLVTVMTMKFDVWGVSISLMSIFIGMTLTSIVVGAVFKLFD